MNEPTSNIGKSDAIPNNVKQPNEKKGAKINNVRDDGNVNNVGTLTEKQLRKLEWEKKLAAEKLKSVNKDVKENANKAELKAKRREQQEAQRQAKAERTKAPVTEVKAPSENQTPKPADRKKALKVVSKKPAIKRTGTKIAKSKYIQLVQHLLKEPQQEVTSISLKDIHPSFLKLGLQYSERIIVGSHARCLALGQAIKTLIIETKPPPKQEFCKYLDDILQKCTNYLQSCRLFSVSMTHALKSFTSHLHNIPLDTSDSEKKTLLLDYLELYVKNDIVKAQQAISMKVNEKIVDGDVILIYGCSSLINQIILDAKRSGKNFSVIVVDSRPLVEGREMIRRLVVANITCRYVLIDGLSSAMKKATKVFLEAHALIVNGTALCRMGASEIALIAQAYDKPVSVCCETYKFCDQIQNDLFIHNELGNPDALLSNEILNNRSPLERQKVHSKVNMINLLYDLTDSDLITAVFTELAITRCTSFPVILRIRAGEPI